MRDHAARGSSTAIRSATSKTSFMLWETSSTARPRSASRAHEVEHHAVWATPSAAVGSSMITSFEFHSTALAMATDCRCPPESDATGWRIERTVVTARLASVSLADVSMLSSSSKMPPSALPAQEHVLHDVEVVAQGEVLVDGLDAERGGVAGRADVHRPPVPADLAAVGRVDAGDALDQHRLAGAVVADERGHLAGRDVEIDVDAAPAPAPKFLPTPRSSQERRAVRGARRRGRLRRSDDGAWPRSLRLARLPRRSSMPAAVQAAGRSGGAEVGDLDELVLDDRVVHVLGR